MADDEPKGRVLGYARASTDKQEHSPDCQKDRIRDYLAQRGLGGDVTFFTDAATSGKVPIDERAAGKELFKQLRRGDHLVITKIDRAFRSTADCALKVDALHRMGVRLHIIDFMGDYIDIGTPQGRMFIHILAAFAQYERELISQRTKEGLAHLKRKGVAHARYPGYGFKWKKVWLDGKLVKVREACPEERQAMQAILRWRIQDNPLTWKEIYDHLTQTLKLKTKDGKPWTLERIRRCCKAELMLQLREQRGNR
jgi:DNA invertase Pin-like site-specific DNA recombinase